MMNKYKNKKNEMATLPATELIVTIDDQSMVNKIKQALKLMKGVCGVKVKRHTIDDKILRSAAYRASMDDVKHGRVYEAASVEDMMKQILG